MYSLNWIFLFFMFLTLFFCYLSYMTNLFYVKSKDLNYNNSKTKKLFNQDLKMKTWNSCW